MDNIEIIYIGAIKYIKFKGIIGDFVRDWKCTDGMSFNLIS